ncbi:MAG: FkbM family methyltransferase [Rhodanobacteraceae bacterium]
MSSGHPKPVELLHLRPPGAMPFVLAVEPQGDDVIVPTMRSAGVWEVAETVLTLRTLRPGMHVIDAGAHVGYYSVLFSRCVGPEGWVLAFEPEPNNYRLLSANLLLNDCRNAQAKALALAASAGRDSLYLSPNNLGDHRLLPTRGRRSVGVQTIDLDTIIGSETVDFVKMDTQGAEPRVLAGMKGIIHNNRERLACMIEFAPGLLAQAGTSVAQFAQQLGDLGAMAYGIALESHNLILQRLHPLETGLANLAAQLATHGQVDASTDLLLLFGEVAERDWLARYCG